MTQRDALAGVFDLLRVRGAVMGYVRASGTWGLAVPRATGATFHAVTAGVCWVRVPGRSPRELLPGDVVLLPAGASHVVAGQPSGPTRTWDRVAKARARNSSGEIVLPGAGKGTGRDTQLICAAFEYDHDIVHPLVSLLPPTLYVSAEDSSDARITLQLLHRELVQPSAGASIIIDRLIDVLFVHVLRAWIVRQTDRGRSWLAGLRHPSVAQALALMHADPGAAWTLDRLARESNVSRASLTRHFGTLVGEAPLAYLTRWRMELAARQLRETTDPVSTIAHRVGYASEFAFSRAFSRTRGRAPGRYRADQRQRSIDREF